MKGLADIKLGEDLSGAKAGEGLVKQRERVSVLSRDLIKFSVINAKAKATVSLFYEEDR
jgi:hypothetical protein